MSVIKLSCSESGNEVRIPSYKTKLMLWIEDNEVITRDLEYTCPLCNEVELSSVGETQGQLLTALNVQVSRIILNHSEEVDKA